MQGPMAWCVAPPVSCVHVMCLCPPGSVLVWPRGLVGILCSHRHSLIFCVREKCISSTAALYATSFYAVAVWAAGSSPLTSAIHVHRGCKILCAAVAVAAYTQLYYVPSRRRQSLVRRGRNYTNYRIQQYAVPMIVTSIPLHVHAVRACLEPFDRAHLPSVLA